MIKRLVKLHLLAALCCHLLR